MDSNVTSNGTTKTETNTTVTNEGLEGATQATAVGGGTANSNNNAEETVTMSRGDFDKAIQSAEDRVRTKYSKDIKALEEKIATLTPPAKTAEETAAEQRLADLGRREKEIEAREKATALRASLQAHNIDMDIADYLTPDVDVEAFGSKIEKLVASRLAADGYKPIGHQTSQPISKSDYDKMSYDEKVELYKRDPEGWKRLRKS